MRLWTATRQKSHKDSLDHILAPAEGPTPGVNQRVNVEQASQQAVTHKKKGAGLISAPSVFLPRPELLYQWL